MAAPLAASRIAELTREPAARGPAGAFLANALRAAAHEVEDRRPAGARDALAPLLARADLSRYRFPCARCGVGSIGIEQIEDEAGWLESPRA